MSLFNVCVRPVNIGQYCSDLGSFIFYRDYFSLVFMDMLCFNNLQGLKIRLKNCSDLSFRGKWNTDSVEKKVSGSHTGILGPNPPHKNKVCLKRKVSYFYNCFLLKCAALKIFFWDHIQMIPFYNCD